VIFLPVSILVEVRTVSHGTLGCSLVFSGRLGQTWGSDWV